MIAPTGEKSGPVVIGYDHRFLSKEAGKWLAESLVTAGLSVAFINYSCPTPLVIYAVSQLGYDYGCMITASHNPAIYNGIKLFTPGGRDADASFTGKLEKTCATSICPLETIEFAQGLVQGEITYLDPLNDYLDNILVRINTAKIRDAHLAVAFDPMFGVATDAVQKILYTARCNLTLINRLHDPLFGRQLPAPTAETTRDLQLLVKTGDYQIGLATDGDADRIGVVDADGTYLDSNKILAIVYYYLIKYAHEKGDVVRNTSTSIMVDRIARANGFSVHEVPVGFKYITAGMVKHNAILGGESSGGLTVRDYLKGKDSVFATALLVEIVAVTGKSFGELWQEIEKEFGKLYTEDIQVNITEAQKEVLRQQLQIPITSPELQIEKRDLTDGQKLWFKDGWCLARLSGTEPLLRISSESEDSRQASVYISLVKKILRC